MSMSAVMKHQMEEDELVWLGGPSYTYQEDDMESLPQIHEDHPAQEAWNRDEWDCPTDIIYHHAQSEDHIPALSAPRQGPIASITIQMQQVKIQEPHPMFAHQPFNAASLRAIKEPYDPATWESPTDIIYSHAEFDMPSSALGLHVPPAIFSPSPLYLPPIGPKRNAFGVPREPYNAATWDSPTDILYSHGKEEDEEIAHRRGSDSDSGRESPYTPYSAFISTPVDDVALLPDDETEMSSKGVAKKTVEEDFIVRAGRRLAETLVR